MEVNRIELFIFTILKYFQTLIFDESYDESDKFHASAALSLESKQISKIGNT